MSNEGIKLTNRQKTELTDLLWGSLAKTHEGCRAKTGWGAKTETGLLACIETIINEGRDESEHGAAEIVVALDNSVITVKHGANGSVLGRGIVKRGAWDELWACLKKIGVQGLE